MSMSRLEITKCSEEDHEQSNAFFGELKAELNVTSQPVVSIGKSTPKRGIR